MILDPIQTHSNLPFLLTMIRDFSALYANYRRYHVRFPLRKIFTRSGHLASLADDAEFAKHGSKAIPLTTWQSNAQRYGAEFVRIMPIAGLLIISKPKSFER